jgi:ubiquinone biosynthesis protein UbiJ
MNDNIESPKRGRPPGTDESPESLIKKELIAHLKLYRRLREIVQKRVDMHGDEMQPDDLSKFMDLLRKGVVEMARPIIGPAKGDSNAKQDEEDPSKILAALLSTTKP